LVIPGSHSPQPPGQHKTLGDVLEQALQAAPLSHLQQGKANQALELPIKILNFNFKVLA